MIVFPSLYERGVDPYRVAFHRQNRVHYRIAYILIYLHFIASRDRIDSFIQFWSNWQFSFQSIQLFSVQFNWNDCENHAYSPDIVEHIQRIIAATESNLFVLQMVQLVLVAMPQLGNNEKKIDSTYFTNRKWNEIKSAFPHD